MDIPLSLEGLIYLWRRQCWLPLDTWTMWNSRTPPSLCQTNKGYLNRSKTPNTHRRYVYFCSFTVLTFSTSIKTKVPRLPLSSTEWGGGAVLRQAEAWMLRERLVQINTVWRNTRWLHMQKEAQRHCQTAMGQNRLIFCILIFILKLVRHSKTTSGWIKTTFTTCILPPFHRENYHCGCSIHKNQF